MSFTTGITTSVLNEINTSKDIFDIDEKISQLEHYLINVKTKKALILWSEKKEGVKK